MRFNAHRLWPARWSALAALVMGTWLSLGGAARAEDLLEFLSGAKLSGRVVKIDKEAKKVTFEATIGGTRVEKVYDYSKIHAVTYDGKRYVLTKKTGDEGKRPKKPTDSNDATADDGATSKKRTPAELEKLIDAAAEPPDWLESTALDYPATLDLSFPEKPEGGWNNQKNFGQFYWDIVNPNPARWKSGIKLSYHLLEMHRGDAATKKRIMSHLGIAYFSHFQDYARAAYCLRQGGAEGGNGVALAECYWRLGNRGMAEKLITNPDGRKAATINHGMIKLWGDMGEPAKAEKLGELYVRSGGQGAIGFLLIADAWRTAGNYSKAAGFYQKALDAPTGGKNNDRYKSRAQASLEAIRLFAQSDVAKVPDGSYRSSSQGYEGPIEVEVTVAEHKITAVQVTNHTEKQFYSALEDVPRQIIAKNGVKGIEATSRATITAEAIINATAKALAGAAK